MQMVFKRMNKKIKILMAPIDFVMGRYGSFFTNPACLAIKRHFKSETVASIEHAYFLKESDKTGRICGIEIYGMRFGNMYDQQTHLRAKKAIRKSDTKVYLLIDNPKNE